MVRQHPPLSRAEREATDWLTRLQLGDGSEQAEFDAWLAADPANTAAFEAVRQSVATTDVAAGSKLVRNSRLHRASVFQRKPGTTLALAAGLAALTVIGGGVALQELDNFRPSLSADQTAVYATRTGELRTLALADGSKVTLDAGSLLRVTYTADARRIRLDSGRARFEVAHDSARPFIVSAGDGSIVARGTVFDVSVGPSGVHVVLLKGSVEVTRNGEGAGQSADAPPRQLRPGQQVTFDSRNPVPEPVPASSAELRWTAGMLAFDHVRLADAVAELNRYSARKIRLATPELGDRRIGGGYRAGDVEGFARAAAAALDLRIESRADGILLAPARYRENR